ncbi:phage virion morphogenesis protein [uncultured Bilophila sp.]|uniref:phage virion morphogenesis protein n=2 Tax=uncultured Bilophila sp. TaxID=529385 RepID=UPI0025FAF9DF|nr:phage virion morphogenesis protein [uncultured Bilophila sp.]
MAKSGVSLNWGGFDRRLMEAARGLAAHQAILADIGEALVSSTVQHFVEGKGPDGEGWKPSERSARDGGKPLSDTGRLRQSIEYTTTPDSVMVGTNVIYGRIHQLGGEIRPKRKKALKVKGKLVSKVTMPARPYLYIDDEDREEVAHIIALHTKGKR